MADNDVPPPEFFERASDEPDVIALDPLRRSLRADDDAIRRATAEALYDVAAANPTRIAEEGAVPALLNALDDENPLVRERIAMALANVAEESDALAPMAESLTAGLGDEYDVVTDYLAHALRCIAVRTPGAVTDHVTKLLSTLGAEMKSARYHVVSALVAVADERPDAIRPAVESLLDVVDGRDTLKDEPDQIGSSKGGIPETESEGSDASGVPSRSEPVVADDTTNDLAARTVEAALIVLAKLAAARPADAAADLRRHVPRLRRRLDDPHGGIRAVTAGILAAVAEYEPQAVEPATAQLAERLDDDVTTAAGNAAWALRYIETPAAEEALCDAQPADDDVQAVIEAALADL